jgi:paraquat-inducible protein A
LLLGEVTAKLLLLKPNSHCSTDYSKAIACHDCDALFQNATLEEGERVVCPNCGSRLTEHKKNDLERAAAFTLSALILFAVAHFFPFLSMQAGGQTNEIALFNSAGALYANGSPLLAVLVAVFIIAAPATLILGMLYVLLPLFGLRALPGAKRVCRWVYDSGPWNMIEVFMLGILVSLMKLTKIASVHLGVSFWALALLIVFVTAALNAIDRVELWRRLEEAEPVKW